MGFSESDKLSGAPAHTIWGQREHVVGGGAGEFSAVSHTVTWIDHSSSSTSQLSGDLSGSQTCPIGRTASEQQRLQDGPDEGAASSPAACSQGSHCEADVQPAGGGGNAIGTPPSAGSA